jgi:hypothetical protein
MKSLVLLTFLSLSPDAPGKLGQAEFFDNEPACSVRMDQIRAGHPDGLARCTCHKTVEEVTVEGNDGI